MTNNKLLQFSRQCQNNANLHGWKVVWSRNEEEVKDVGNVPKYKYLSIGDAIALCHSELSEALEAYRDNDKTHFSEEIADEFIRLFHLCGDLNIDINKAICMKMAMNRTRPVNHGRANF
jgi:NTP pyrophosphatase (non-canonical NTP hydrolase)